MGTWDPVVTRFKKKFMGWKRTLLSKGEDSSLWKVYWVIYPFICLSWQCRWEWSKVLKKKFQYKFLSGGLEDRRRYHLIAWDELKKPFSNRGLGFWSLVGMNAALQGASGSEGLWMKNEHYGEGW